MPEPITLLGALKAATPSLLKIAPWAWKSLPRNTPVAKAIRATSEHYSSRLPSIESALEKWVLCDAFRSHVEQTDSGALTDAEVFHVDLFITTTGYRLGLGSLETVAEGLSYFYAELCGQLLDGEHGMRLLAAKVETNHREVMEHLTTRPVSETESLPYRPPIQTDAVSRAITDEDRKAELTLDLIKVLLDQRKSSTALSLISTLQNSVDNGHISTPVRFRFFVNKGVCMMLEGKWDQAQVEFQAAHILEPRNKKAIINLAQVEHFKDCPAEALALLERVISEDPGDSNANSLRLVCLHKLGREDEVQRSLEAQPALAEDTGVLYTLAYIAFDQQKFDEAEHYLRRHNDLESTYAEAWEMLGRAILVPTQQLVQQTAASPNWIPDALKKKIVEAEACFFRAAELLSTSESQTELKFTLVNRGVARSLLGRFDDARQDYERALQIAPSQQEVMRNLGTLLFWMGRAEEAIHYYERIDSPSLRPSVAPLLAAAYLDSNDASAARALLEPLVDSLPEDQTLFAKDLLLVAYQRLKDVGGCVKVLDSLATYPENPHSHRIAAEYYAREGNIENAVTEAQLAVAKAGESRAARFRLLLGDVLYQAKRFDEAADIYSLVPVPPNESHESRRYLIALFNAGRLRKALHLAEAIRNGRPATSDFFEIEALIHERAGDLDVANRLRGELLEAGVRVSQQRLKIALNHFRRGRLDDAARLVNEVDLESIATDSQSLRDSAMMRTVLGLPQALAFAWRMLQIDYEDPEAHIFYVNTFLRREEVDKELFHPESITVDCVATLRRGAENLILTIVEGDSDTARNVFSSEHPFAKALSGKRMGERVLHPPEGISAAEYEVLSIQSKYVQAFQDCMGRFNERFPAHYGMTRIEMEGNDVSKITAILERQRAHSQQALDLYRRGQLPACAMARLFGKSDAEMFRALVEDPQIKVLTYDGAAGRLDEEALVLASAKSILVETSALITLQSLGLMDRLYKAFDTVFVTQLQIDSLAELLANLFPEDHTGHLVSDSPGHVHVVNRSSEEALRERTFYEQLLELSRTRCQVSLAIGCGDTGEFCGANAQRLLGPVAISTLSAAVETNSALISDDLPLRALALNSDSIVSIGTLSLLKHLRLHARISASEYHAAIQWLVEKQYSFVSIDSDDVVWVLQKSDWLPTAEAAKFLQVLSGPECDVTGAIRVGLDFLYRLWNEPLPITTQQLVSDLVIQVLVTGREFHSALQAIEESSARRSLIWTPAMGRIQAVVRSWRRRGAWKQHGQTG